MRGGSAVGFDVGPWRVCPELNTLVLGNQELHVSPKAMDVLVYLAGRAGQVVSREELFREVWAGANVTDDALNRCIGEIRRAVNEDSRNPAVIETVRKRGYRVVAPVSPAAHGQPLVDQQVCSPTPWRRSRLVLAGVTAATACIIASLTIFPVFAPQRHNTDSIAVLPLVNLTGDPGQDYLADTITEELTTELVHHGWTVVSRTSAMQKKGAKQTLMQMAADLHVNAVLEGAIQRSGSTVRITVQLIDAKTDLHRWSGAFEGEFSNVVRLQTSIARAVGSELRFARNTGDEDRRKPDRKIVPEAYEAYLKGLYFFRQAKFETAASYFERSTTTDPRDAMSYALLYEADAMLAFYGDAAPGERALHAMRTALTLDESSAEARTNLGDLKFWWEWDWAAGEAEFRRAVELDRYSVQAALHYCTCLNALGRFAAAMLECQRALRLDPVSEQVNAAILVVLVNTHRWREALEQYRRMAELYPEAANIHESGGFVLNSLGSGAEAVGAFLQANRLSGKPQDQIAALERAGRSDGLRGYWRERVRQLGNAAETGDVPPFELAQTYVMAGDNDSAIRMLEAAYNRRAPRLVWLKASAIWDPLRPDPRFQSIISRMAFPK